MTVATPGSAASSRSRLPGCTSGRSHGWRARGTATIHHWFDSWAGVGLLAAGLQRQGWDLQLTAYGDGPWRATCYLRGQAHSIVGGSAWEPAPWTAVQWAAWEPTAWRAVQRVACETKPIAKGPVSSPAVRRQTNKALGMCMLTALVTLAGCADHTWCMSWMEAPDGRVLGPIVTLYCGHSTPNYGFTPVCQKVKRTGDDSYVAIGPKQACP
jgi:hypothetical protein